MTLRRYLCSAASDVRLHVRVAWEQAPVGAALGLLGQHVVGGPRVFRGGPLLAGLEPAVDQGHEEQHHTPDDGGHPRQGEGQCKVPEVVVEEPWGGEGRGAGSEMGERNPLMAIGR